MINRRQFLETTAALIGSSPVYSAFAQQNETAEVFFSKEISPQSLIKMFKLVGGNLNGKIAIKLHTGEPHGPNIIPSPWVQNCRNKFLTAQLWNAMSCTEVLVKLRKAIVKLLKLTAGILAGWILWTKTAKQNCRQMVRSMSRGSE